MRGTVTVKYQRLSQSTPSDEEDEGFEDNILFDSRLVNTPSDLSRNAFEVERLGLPKSKSFRGSFLHLGSTKCKQICCCTVVLLCIIIGTLLAILFPIIHHAVSSGNVTTFQFGPSKKDWDQAYVNMWTESSIRMHDIDKDGLDDIVIGLANHGTIDALLSRTENMSMMQFCKDQEFRYPCGGMVTALRGFDGTQIWTSPTRSIVIYQNCADIDANGDGQNDCIVTGRHSTCQAIDATNGRLLWIVDPDSPSWSSHLIPHWTIYQPAIVPDLDSDGFMDILISHGGDNTKEAWDHKRQAGRLILLSGKSGLPIGKQFVELPDNKETYMPPIKYVTASGVIYILVGNGGETVSGHLYAISLVDIYKQTTGSAAIPDTLVASESQDLWGTGKKRQNGFNTLLSGNISGVMVPPILVDSDTDGHMDLLVSTFDGQVALLSGSNFAVRWSRAFEGMETYSSPSPGLFNNDMVLDFMVHLNKGVWDRYNGSTTLVLNGIDGSTLWSVDAESYAYSSDLSLHTVNDKSDVFVFKMVGLNSNISSHLENQSLRKRHMGGAKDETSTKTNDDMTGEEFQIMCEQVMSQLASAHPVCDTNLHTLTQEIFLLDRWMSSSPVRILQQKAERHRYQLDHKLGDRHCHALSPQQKNKIDMCEVLVPTSYTGAVSDVDGDGSPDYIHVSHLIGTQRSDTLSSMNFISKVILSKRSLQDAIDQEDFVHLDAEKDVETIPNSLTEHLKSIKFKSPSGQPWTQYLGTTGHSCYQNPHS